MSWSDASVLAVMLGWIPPLGLGLVLLLKKNRTAFHSLLGGILLVLGIIWLAGAHQVSAARGIARAMLCRNNLAELGLALRMYRDDYNAQLPPSLEPLPRYLGRDFLFTCPTDSMARNGGYAYLYLPVKDPKPSDMVCWDPVPHVTRHGILRYLSTTQRNVLFADGHVNTVSEAEFQILYAKQTGESSH